MTEWGWAYAITPSWYEVDRATWADASPITTVLSCSVDRSESYSTFEKASLTLGGNDMGERWVRCYETFTGADGVSERVPMGTWLIQTPKRTLDGSASVLQCTAYSALHPLNEARAALGEAVYAPGTNCLQMAAEICERHGIAPVIPAESDAILSEWYVAQRNTPWLDVARTLSAAAGYDVRPDHMGRVTFTPQQRSALLRPFWTFDENDGSVMMPNAEESRDWYGVPNRCIIAATGKDGELITGMAVNEDPGSPASTVARGRIVDMPNVVEPDELKAGATQAAADALAARALEEASATRRIVTINHGYCPLEVGHCAHVDYRSLGLVADAKVTDQKIVIGSDVSMTSTMVETERMWIA